MQQNITFTSGPVLKNLLRFAFVLSVILTVMVKRVL
ncbi:hypothetical protein SAMN05216431_1184 [Ligilactobacillus sp. WC1T17]|uniref:Uncharacterized protein n=1 Tax=Ligilactobacillus ruminis TaxID=1623 RepID=A0ABY1AEH1_9LACO|nr:hypothetical protein SAMN05216431_1184 [Ligilactobacillus ruminis]